MEISGSISKRSERVVPEDQYEIPVVVRLPGRKKIPEADLEHVIPDRKSRDLFEKQEPANFKNQIEQRLNLITNYSKQIDNLMQKIDREKNGIISILHNFKK